VKDFKATDHSPPQIIFCWRRDRREGSGYGSKDPDLKPDPHQNVPDPEHCHKENLTLENMYLHFSEETCQIS
jgi:hypothetical protein